MDNPPIPSPSHTTALGAPALERSSREEVAISGGAPKERFRWRLLTAAILLIVVGVLAGAALVNRAGDRVNVVAVARDVQAGQKIKAADLKVASFAEDPAFTPLKASKREELVGKRAAVDLRSGTLLTESQLASGGGLGDDQQVIGVEVKRGQVPAGALSAGDQVLAVHTPGQGQEVAAEAKRPKRPGSVKASVVSVGKVDGSGALTINLAVDPADGPALAVQAAAKEIALVRQPRSQ